MGWGKSFYCEEKDLQNEIVQEIEQELIMMILW